MACFGHVRGTPDTRFASCRCCEMCRKHVKWHHLSRLRCPGPERHGRNCCEMELRFTSLHRHWTAVDLEEFGHRTGGSAAPGPGSSSRARSVRAARGRTDIATANNDLALISPIPWGHAWEQPVDTRCNRDPERPHVQFRLEVCDHHSFGISLLRPSLASPSICIATVTVFSSLVA